MYGVGCNMKWYVVVVMFVIMVVAWLFLDVTMMGDYSIIRDFLSTSITDLNIFGLICIIFLTNLVGRW